MLEANQGERLRVVLVRTRNPLNIGAAARAMSNFGFSHLRVVNPYDAGFQEARSAVGAAKVLASAEAYASVAEAVADCTLVVGTTSVGSRQLQQPLKSLQAAAPLIRKHLASGGVALLFGSEKIGLRNEDLSYCHWLMRIPTREQHRSMNLGQAVAVCLYELARDSAPRGGRARQLTPDSEGGCASAEHLERLTTATLEALRESGFVSTPSLASDTKIRRLIRRLNLNAEDAETLLGMIRQMLWKLKATATKGD